MSLSAASVEGTSPSLTTQAAPQAVAGTCADGTIDVNPMADRTVVHATSPINGALTLQRLREYGSWRTIATGSGTTLKVNDTTVNENVSYQYRLIAKNGTDPDFDCSTEFMYGMWTRDGAGDPDAVVAGTTGIFQQGMFSVGSRAVANEYQSPRYSTDGRLYAATKVIDDATGRAVLEVRRASSSALVFTVDLGTGAFPADPDFSPDGQTIAYTRYAADTGRSLGLGFVDVFGPHTKTVLDTTTRIGEPSWRPDGTSLVVSTFGVTTPGLAVVTKATGGRHAAQRHRGRVHARGRTRRHDPLRLDRGRPVVQRSAPQGHERCGHSCAHLDDRLLHLAAPDPGRHAVRRARHARHGRPDELLDGRPLRRPRQRAR